MAVCCASSCETVECGGGADELARREVGGSSMSAPGVWTRERMAADRTVVAGRMRAGSAEPAFCLKRKEGGGESSAWSLAQRTCGRGAWRLAAPRKGAAKQKQKAMVRWRRARVRLPSGGGALPAHM